MPPRGAARQEWRIIDDLSRRIGIAPYSLAGAAHARAARATASRRGAWSTRVLRTGPAGDWFGLRRSGLSLKKVARSPHGIVLGDHIATGRARRVGCGIADRRVHVGDAAALGEIDRLEQSNGARAAVPAEPDRPARAALAQLLDAQLAAADARRPHARAADPSRRRRGRRPRRRRPRPHHVRIGRRWRRRCIVTDEMTPGTVALPHGWGHRGGWQLANEAGGANVNQLAPSDPEGLERLAGMAHLNGIPVRVEAVARARAEAPRAPSRAPARSEHLPASHAGRRRVRGRAVRRARHAGRARAAVAAAARRAAVRGTASRSPEQQAKRGDARRDVLLQGPPHGGTDDAVAGRTCAGAARRCFASSCPGHRARRADDLVEALLRSIRVSPLPGRRPGAGPPAAARHPQSAVVSNWDVSLRECSARSASADSSTTSSCRPRWAPRSPTPDDLRVRAAKATMSRRKALFVGDSPETDIAGAHRRRTARGAGGPRGHCRRSARAWSASSPSRGSTSCWRPAHSPG